MADAIPLLSGAYQAKSLIAACQRCINLYPEANPAVAQAPTQVTHYPTAGLVLQIAAPINAPVRQVYKASNGTGYCVIGPGVYVISPSFTLTFLGYIGTNTGPVSIADNGLAAIVVDNTTKGWAIDLDKEIMAAITDTSFYGATKVDYLDTYFILNRPKTTQFYISLSEATFDMLTGVPGSILTGQISTPGSGYTDGTYFNVTFSGGSGSGAEATFVVLGGAVTKVTITTKGQNYAIGDVLGVSGVGSGSGFVYSVNSIGGYAFDPLDIAAKVGYPDPISTLIVMHKEIWLIGTLTTEIWYNSGAADFTFQQLPGAFVEHGCIAPYSIAAADLAVYWVSQDKQGARMILKGMNYQVHRISTHAIEQEMQGYEDVSDAVGYTYQEQGHIFYVIAFPSANKTWVYDEATEMFHERCWTNAEGKLERHRFNCTAAVYGKNLVGDWENGQIYYFDVNTFTDNNQPITRIRTIPHMIKTLNRVAYTMFTADVEVGENTTEVDSTGLPPEMSLRWSDDRGKTFSNRIQQSIGRKGQYNTLVQWQRLGMARDRVFELSWSHNTKTALNGAFVNMTQCGS